MNALPHSPYMRAIVEAQEEAQDDRTDVQKLHEACRVVVDTREQRDFSRRPFKEAEQALDHAFTSLVEILSDQFGDEVDIELLAKALAS